MTDGMAPQDVIESKHAMTGFAELFWHYYNELTKQGFTNEEAIRLVIGYQHDLFIGAKDD